MSQVKAGNLTKGMFVIFKGAPHIITKTEFMAPGKGSAIMRCRLKNVQTDSVQDFTYKTNEMVEEADVERREMQFLYQDGSDAYFMDPRTYDQIGASLKLLEGKTGYLVPDLLCYVLFYEERVIGVKLPKHVNLKVAMAEDAVAGNRVNAPKKPVTLETGLEVMVPLFIKTGDVLSLDTETGEYLSRVS